MKFIKLFFCLLLSSYGTQAQVMVGAERIPNYIDLIKNKRVALVVNQTSMVGESHLVDTLLALGVKISVIFAPEHGFRGDHDAGKKIDNARDEKTGLSILSLYGKTKKPNAQDLKNTDLVIFDIQDVGVRFYTYISTMHYVMEACAENKKEFMVLDRPNPNGFFIDGPVLEPGFTSFVGMHPIPLVHGLTVGELAGMINGEGWLKGGVKCSLTVIPVENYTHSTIYKLPVKPSPNLPTMNSIYLYPSLGLFEGTNISVGRGTGKPFEVVGRPGFTEGRIEFTPHSIPGVAENPPYKDTVCQGFDLSFFCNSYVQNSRKLYMYWLDGFYKAAPDKNRFFNDFFDKLAGTDSLRKQLQQGMSVEDIQKSWQPGLAAYRPLREKYLLYMNFRDN
jgi:uncharacterized protein YbbC (DUF1343 family)